MSSSLQPEVLNWGGVWMCVGTISIVSTIDRIQLIVCVCFFNKKWQELKQITQKKILLFTFRTDCETRILFLTKSQILQILQATSQFICLSFWLRVKVRMPEIKEGKKRVQIMREKSKSNPVGHQRSRPSAVKVCAGSGPSGCERQAAVAISWSRSVIAAAGLPPPSPTPTPATHGPPGRSVYGTHPSFWLWAHSCYSCLLCLKKVIYKSRLRRHYAD